MREKAGCLCLLAHSGLTNGENLPKQPQYGYPTNTMDEDAKRKRVIRNPDHAAGSKIGLVLVATLQRCKFQKT